MECHSHQLGSQYSVSGANLEPACLFTDMVHHRAGERGKEKRRPKTPAAKAAAKARKAERRRTTVERIASFIQNSYLHLTHKTEDIIELVRHLLKKRHQRHVVREGSMCHELVSARVRRVHRQAGKQAESHSPLWCAICLTGRGLGHAGEKDHPRVRAETTLHALWR